jgi:sterol desaturase/sphingolipid hydroxylase (fatty acid hydroxylase superfamily)
MFNQPKYQLDRMAFRDLLIAYFRYPAIQVYIALFLVSAVVVWRASAPTLAGWGTNAAIAVVFGVLIFPLLSYSIHRFILHGRFMYRWRWLAIFYKRVHYDHHQNPNDLRVLFGALPTTMPPLVLLSLLPGLALNGVAGAAAAFAGGLWGMLFYEYCHCIQHLHYIPRLRFFRRIKRHHLLHHFYNESGNFSLNAIFWDRLTGTYYAKPGDMPKSATVFNLGYTGSERTRYPWVARLNGEAPGEPAPR